MTVGFQGWLVTPEGTGRNSRQVIGSLGYDHNICLKAVVCSFYIPDPESLLRTSGSPDLLYDLLADSIENKAGATYFWRSKHSEPKE